MEPAPPLVTQEDVVQELHRLFGATGDAGLVIRVYGQEAGRADDTADATFREMLASLRMHDATFGSGETVAVQAPSRASLARALSVLGREEHQRRILADVLTTLGRRLIDPLGAQLDPARDGTLTSRLGMMRDLCLAHVVDLRLTAETQQIVSEDLRKLLSDEYLAMLADHEERVQRPRVTRLAQEVLRLIGGVFRRAFQRWPEHADRLAGAMARRLGPVMNLRDVPKLLREQITGGVEEFLWVETSTEIEGALRALFAEHAGTITVGAPRLDRDAYREFAGSCFRIIAEHC